MPTRVKCATCQLRWAKVYRPTPQCRQCVTGRKPGQRGPDTKWRVSHVRRRPSTLDKMVEAEKRERERRAS